MVSQSNDPSELKDYKEVLSDASQNWHKNDLKDFEEISRHLESEYGAKINGSYSVSNMQIDLVVSNPKEQPLFEIKSAKLEDDINVKGIHTNEDFAFLKNDSMSVDMIKQQYTVESYQQEKNIFDLESKLNTSSLSLENEFLQSGFEQHQELQTQFDIAANNNSIEFSSVPEQQINLDHDQKTESPIVLENTVSQDSNLRGDQNASIPEQIQQTEPPLSATTNITEKVEIQQSVQPLDTPVKDKGAVLDKVGYEVPQSVSSDFVHTPSDSSFKPSKFYEKSNPVAVAFEDRGKSLSSSRDDNKTIAAMVAVAKSKNWNEIQVKGTQEFKRKAWLEAASQGINVKGYKPNEQDMAALQVKQEQMSRNQIHQVPQREQQTQVTKTQELKTELNPNIKEHEQAKIITARRILEDTLKKQEKKPEEMKKILSQFDQMTKNPENVQKLVAAQVKQTKEIEHRKTTSQERSR